MQSLKKKLFLLFKYTQKKKKNIALSTNLNSKENVVVVIIHPIY